MTAMRSDLPGGLPRLCYLGSVQVEATSAGQVLMHRLLQNYPPESLQIIETECRPSEPSRRLPGVSYTLLEPLFERGWFFARTRLPRVFWAMLEAHTSWQAWRAARLLAPFRPEAILTVHELLGWLTAAKLARRLRVPLHFILHDDWYRNVPMAKSLEARFEHAFGDVYRQAVSRFCICSSMEAEYAQRFGVPGTALYPTQDPGMPPWEAPPSGLGDPAQPLQIAYAGNVFNEGNWEALRHLAVALDSVHGKLVFYGPVTLADARAHGLTGENIVARGWLRPSEVAETLRREVQATFVPMTFDPADARFTQLSFPSKLAEYTAAGLPLVVYGPPYCSAVRWARENPGVAEVVDVAGAAGLVEALRRVAGDGDYRKRLGQRSLEIGRRFFSHDVSAEIFLGRMGCTDGERRE